MFDAARAATTLRHDRIGILNHVTDTPSMSTDRTKPDGAPLWAEQSPASATRDATGRKNMLALIQLRWIAIFGQLVTIALVGTWFDADLPLMPMTAVLGALVALNLISLAWIRRGGHVSSRALLLALVLDVCALTTQLWLSGGTTNPFASLFLLQVTLAAVLLEAWATWVIVGLTCISFAGLFVSYRPLILSGTELGGVMALHTAGAFVCFLLDASLLVVFVTRIMRNLRDRDAGLAALRQYAAEEDHIVRMGLLAAGAAHELGTPLSSLSVILGDWRHMPAFADPDMALDLEEMRTAIERCKTIVTGILLASGEARGEAPIATSVGQFLGDLAEDWRNRRPSLTLSYENRFGSDLSIIVDSALKQIISNVLDNAAEASPHWVGFTVERSGEMLVLRISDDGPGFSSEMLARFGQPYQSTKARRGGGLGLFLVVNVVRKLGGSVVAENRLAGGAMVTLTVPLTALAIGMR